MINEPLLIIDGARTHASQPDRGFSERELPSRLEDIDMENVERIEVLRGAAASAMYGPGASRGVILVTTRRARHTPARWTAFAESGPMFEATEFPTNFGTLGTSTVSGAPVTNCPLYAQASGICTPTARQSWNPLESAGPFRTGWSNSAGLDVSGGTHLVNYRAGGNHERAQGVYENDRGDITNARMSLGVTPHSTVDVRVSGAYRTERYRHPHARVIALGLGGAFADDPVRRGFADEIDVVEDLGRREETGRRITGTFDAVWRARDWLRASASVGYDRVRSTTDVRERIPPFDPAGDTTRRTARTWDAPSSTTITIQTEALTGRGTPRRGRTIVGLQTLHDHERTRSFERRVRDGDGPAVSEERSYSDLRREAVALYALQHYAWERLFLTGSVRLDFPRHAPIGTIISPSLDASWLAVGGARRGPAWLDELRFRGAVARGGGHLVAGASGGDFGVDPTPWDDATEESTELELGLDASLFSRRVQTELTLYHAINDRALFANPGPPFGSGRVTRDARFATSGLESVVALRVLQTSSVAWDLDLGLALHRSDVRRYPHPSASFGAPTPATLGEFIASPYTFVDADGDGRIGLTEVDVVDDDLDALVRAGSPFPSYEAGVRSRVQLGRNVMVTAQLDRQGGHKVYNAVAAGRCGFDARCEDQHDPTTSLARQAAAVADRLGSPLGYIEDAGFTKLREVSVAIALPRSLTGAAASGRITLAGRNLHTWTSYSGLDPEIVTGDRNSTFVVANAFQPPLRTFTARLDIGW